MGLLFSCLGLLGVSSSNILARACSQARIHVDGLGRWRLRKGGIMYVRTMRRQTTRVHMQVAQVFRLLTRRMRRSRVSHGLKKWMGNDGLDDDAKEKQMEALDYGPDAVWRDCTASFQ